MSKDGILVLKEPAVFYWSDRCKRHQHVFLHVNDLRRPCPIKDCESGTAVEKFAVFWEDAGKLWSRSWNVVRSTREYFRDGARWVEDVKLISQERIDLLLRAGLSPLKEIIPQAQRDSQFICFMHAVRQLGGEIFSCNDDSGLWVDEKAGKLAATLVYCAKTPQEAAPPKTHPLDFFGRRIVFDEADTQFMLAEPLAILRNYSDVSVLVDHNLFLKLEDEMTRIQRRSGDTKTASSP